MGADGTLLVTWLTLRQSESGSNAAVLGPQPGALWRIQQLAHHAGFNDGPVSSVAPDGTAAVAWRETDSQGAPLPTPLRIAAPGQDFQTPLYAGGSDPPAALLADRGGGIDLLLASAHTVTEWTRTPGGSTSPRMLISGDSGAARFIAGVRGQVLRVLRRTAYSADFHELLSERGADGAFSAPRTAYGSTLSIALAPDVDGTTLAALSPLTGELTISVGSIPRDGTLGPTQLVAPAGNTPSVLVSESGTAIISYFVSTERPDRSYDTVARFLRRDPPYVDTAPPVATVSSPALVSPAAQTVVLAVSCNEPCRAKPEYGARTSWHSAKVTYRVRANLATRQRRALRAGKPITVRLQISDRAGNTRRLAQRVRPRPPAHRPG
jgi:hypothetical protein